MTIAAKTNPRFMKRVAAASRMIRPFRRTSVIWVVALLQVAAVFAAPPPEWVHERRLTAGFHIQLRVLELEGPRKDARGITTCSVTGEVAVVFRSMSRALRVGDRLVFPVACGPNPVGVLSQRIESLKAATYLEVYLDEADQGFVVAGGSVQVIPDITAQPAIPAFRLLEPVGTASALKGTVVHTPGSVVAVDPGGRAYNPALPDRPIDAPTGGTVYTVSDCPLPPEGGLHELPRAAEETLMMSVHGSVGGIKDAVVAVVAGPPSSEHSLNAQLATRELAVFVGKSEIARAAIDRPGFPCGLILDDLNDRAGNEIAVVWASIAAGYTMGVTVFAAR